MKQSADMITVGWREWLSLPELGIEQIKAKVDTGARTSALHAFNVEPFQKDGVDLVRFWIHPIQKNTEIELECVAPILDQRWVTDSGGHKEQRYVIETPLRVGSEQWPIEMTITNRDTMKFRMLLGRTAMRKKILVNPAKSYMTGRR